MTYNQYQQLAYRTCAQMKDIKMDLAHMVLGLGSELHEVQDADTPIATSDELNDIRWYIANYCNFRGLSYEDISTNLVIGVRGNGIDLLINSVSKLQDMVKKYIAYNKEIDKNKELQCLIDIESALCRLSDFYLLNIEQGMINNIDKLRTRFPEKFSEELAINKDTDAEYLMLRNNVLR